ncbi:MAG: aspartate/glutamate racemase family protein, partial [Acidovorax sp.]|uniref:aspartate/glutamate racemase family protein n=1 Tax=Acidovorax sp. TaxID=1872122 RepID=UPI0039E661E7
MPKLLLINPNTSRATTEMMAEVIRSHMAGGVTVQGVTARSGVPLISTPAELAASAAQVLALCDAAGPGWAGIVVGCFGDPGVAALRARTRIPVVGICEAALTEAAEAGRRFGIATTTPDLADAIAAHAAQLGLGAQYTGLRATAGDPRAWSAQPALLEQALARAAADCVALDGA